MSSDPPPFSKLNTIMLISHGRHVLPYLEVYNRATIDRFFEKLLDELDRRDQSIHDLANTEEVFKAPLERAIILLLCSSHLQELYRHLQRDEDNPEVQDLLAEVRERLINNLERLCQDYAGVIDVTLVTLWMELNKKPYKGPEHAPPVNMLMHSRGSCPPSSRRELPASRRNIS